MSTKTAADRTVERYLREVARHLHGLSSEQRRRILDELAAHIAEARRESSEADNDGVVRMILDRVGDPVAIAAEAAAERERERGPAGRTADAVAPWLTLFGGFVFVVGWFAGVVLLLSSPTWRPRDKALGVLVFPFGLLSPALLLEVPLGFTLPLPVGLVVLVALVVGPIVTTWHLLRARQTL